MIEYFRDSAIEHIVTHNISTLKNKMFYLFYRVASNFRCHPIIYTILMLWSSIQVALAEISLADGQVKFELAISGSLLMKILFFYMDSFKFYGCIAILLFLLIVFGIAIIILVKSSNSITGQNESNMRLPGKIYGILFCLVQTVFSLPILVSSILSYSCSLFKAGSSFKCFSMAHILVSLGSGIIIVLFCILIVASSLFAQLGSLTTAAWSQCGISIVVTRLIKNALIVIARCFPYYVSAIVFLAMAFASDAALLVNLICWQHYESLYIEGVDILYCLIGLWWEVGSIATLVHF